MNIPLVNQRASASARETQSDHPVTQPADPTVQQNPVSILPPHDNRLSLLQRAVSTETQRRLQLQGVSAVMPASAEAIVMAWPRVSVQGQPPRSDVSHIEPRGMARRLVVQIASADPDSYSPGIGFGAALRSQGTPINLPPRLDLGNMASTAGVMRQGSRPPSPAPLSGHRRSRSLAFDDSHIPPDLRPPPLIRDHMRHPQRSLDDMVANWSTTRSLEALAELQSRWRDISAEDGAHTFGEFLARLNENINAENPSFRQQTSDLLSQMCNDPALRQQVFAISVEATTSCEDRISHTMIMMQTAARAARFKQTSFATDADAIAMQRQFHRLDLLHEMAQTIVAQTGNGSEEIETHLHLLIRHVDKLELKGLVPVMDMFFDGCAQVSSERSATIAHEIRQQENDKFAGWLAHSPSWLDYIARTDKARFDTAQAARDTLFETGFEQRLDARLSDMGLGNDTDPAVRADAERTLGKALSAEMIDEINTGLTNDFLASRGNVHLLDKYWTEKKCALPSLSRLAA